MSYFIQIKDTNSNKTSVIQGAAAGLLSSVIIMSGICIGSIVAAKSGQIVDEILPSSTERCSGNFTTMPVTNT